MNRSLGHEALRVLAGDPFFARQACCAYFGGGVGRWCQIEANEGEVAADRRDHRQGDDRDQHDNPRLRGVLPKEYAKPSLGSTRLARVDFVIAIGLGYAEACKHDVIGRVYEYLLGRFANAERMAGGEFCTRAPSCG